MGGVGDVRRKLKIVKASVCVCVILAYYGRGVSCWLGISKRRNKGRFGNKLCKKKEVR